MGILSTIFIVNHLFGMVLSTMLLWLLITPLGRLVMVKGLISG